MRVNNRTDNLSFLDIIFNALIGVTFLFMLVTVLVNPEAKKDATVNIESPYTIQVEWPNELADDVDTYVQDPKGNLVFFRRREDGLMHLDRDDLGHRHDQHTDDDGNVKYALNREKVEIRGTVSGEYTVNVHAYMKVGPDAVPVTVRLVHKEQGKIEQRKLTLERDGQEKTAFRFTLNANGNVTSVNTLQKSLIESEVGNGEYE